MQQCLKTFVNFAQQRVSANDDDAIADAHVQKSLGQSFGLSGMSENGGIVRFSEDFMKKLRTVELNIIAGKTIGTRHNGRGHCQDRSGLCRRDERAVRN